MDKVLINALKLEKKRQERNIELIASENYVSKSILKLQGSILTNKYAEGYPSKRYYGGCKYIDIFENKAIEYACKLFNCKYANVQPHSGSSANMAVYRSLLEKGDKILSISLPEGGHLTHGSSVSFSGKDYNIVSYSLVDEVLNYKEIERVALTEKPKMIIAGYSAYSRKIDFKKFREIANKCGAYLMVDMAHIAGLVAGGAHENPCDYADVVTSTTHKTLRGPRGGLILTNNEEIIKKINKTIFPGIQGGPLMHVIAAKAECFYEALQKEFVDYQKQVVKNAKAMANSFINDNVNIISGGTDNHMFLVDVKSSYNISGKLAEKTLDNIHITCNTNTIPYDQESPFVTSGIRIGTPAMTTRGLKEEDFELIEYIINRSLTNIDNEYVQNDCKEKVLQLTRKYPINKNNI